MFYFCRASRREDAMDAAACADLAGSECCAQRYQQRQHQLLACRVPVGLAVRVSLALGDRAGAEPCIILPFHALFMQCCLLSDC